jgi:hypothetical protein
VAGNDVFLYSVPADADNDDVRLRDPTVAGGTPAVDQPNLFEDFTDYSFDDTEYELSFAYGPLSEADQPPQWLEDGEQEADGDDLSFATGPVSQPDEIFWSLHGEIEPEEDADFGFVASPLADNYDINPGLVQGLDDQQSENDEVDYSFTNAGLDDEIVASGDMAGSELPFAFEEIDEDDLSFAFGPVPELEDLIEKIIRGRGYSRWTTLRLDWRPARAKARNVLGWITVTGKETKEPRVDIKVNFAPHRADARNILQPAVIDKRAVIARRNAQVMALYEQSLQADLAVIEKLLERV